MSGGGGGIIIIRRLVRQTAESDSVKSKLTDWRLAKYNDIMAVNEADWSAEDFHFIERCIGYAHDQWC